MIKENYAESLVLVLVLLLALGLRLLNLDATSLWLDEIYSIVVTNLHAHPHALNSSVHSAHEFWMEYLSWQPMRIDGLMHALKINVHVPLYYILLNPWLKLFGVNVIGLRSFSVLFSVLTIIPIYWLARSLGGRLLAFFTAFIVAVSPFQLYFAQEGRMYTLVLFWACLASLALWKILYKDAKLAKWCILYAIALAGGFFSHYMFIFFLAFHGLYTLLWFAKTQNWKRFSLLLPAGLVLIGAVCLWFPMYQIQKHGVDTDYHFAKGTVSGLRYLTSLVWQPIVVVAGDNKLERVFYIPILLLLSIITIYRTRFAFQKEGFLAFWVWVPLVVQIFYDLLNQTHTVVVDRYVILIAPAMAIWLGSTLERLWLLNHQRRVMAVLLCMSGLAFANVWAHSPFRDEHNKKDTRGKLLYLAQHAKSSDLVWINGSYGASALAAYYMAQYRPQQPMLYWAKTIHGKLEPMPDKTLLEHYQRVWIFRYRTNAMRGQQEVRDFLSTLYPYKSRPRGGDWWLYCISSEDCKNTL